MSNTLHKIALTVVSIALTGCGGLVRHDGEVAVGIDGLAWFGGPPVPPAGVVETAAPALLDQARAASEKGGICAGKVFSVQRSVRVYRVWDSSKSHSRIGRWWSLNRPNESRETYRQTYAICPSWSALDHLVSCDLVAGSLVVIGTTQSAACEDGVHPKTSMNQVYIANNPAQDQVFVENCKDEGAWP